MPEDKKNTWETPQILSDLPLRNEDQAHFHFDEFAVTLARLISSPLTHTPIVIGVSGPWGSGKTTLLKRVMIKLNETEKKKKPSFVNETESDKSFRTCKTVWFDAWKYNDEGKLLVAFVRVILGTMKKDGLKNKVKAIWEDPHQPKYDLLSMFVNAFQLKFGGLGTEFQIKLDPQGHKEESPFASHTAFFDHFDETFERLLATWVHGKDYEKIQDKKGALVVFIDDLDRCLPEKMIQVLESVKLFLDKPGCIFVIGAHTQVVQDAVKKFYVDMTAETASDYLEKIIQLRFELPPILEGQMGDFITATGLPQESLENWETIVAGAEVNPRKVKTFLNDLNLAWALLVNSGQTQGMERTDFTRWQVLMRAAPSAFKDEIHKLDLDKDLRFKFVQNALAWALNKGDATITEYFKGFDKYNYLKHTLKKIGAFSQRFDAESLDAFIHFVSPPRPPEPEKAPAEVKDSHEKEMLEEEILAEKVVRGEAKPKKDAHRPAVPDRTGMQEEGGLKFMQVSDGKFLMGSRYDNKLADSYEKPQHIVELKDYWIGQFLVTNEQYAIFVEATSQKHDRVKDWKKKLDHPIVNVSWNDAQAYCRWLNETQSTGLLKDYVFRLPTEAEWEKAARGEFGFEWPWGNEFDKNKCNSSEGRRGGTTAVGAYSPAGDSPYGAADMVGNVFEWTQSLFKGYPYFEDSCEDIKAKGMRVVRGGSWFNEKLNARCAYRSGLSSDDHNSGLGFRVVISRTIGS
jgi:formylglycine-generating enzyme required for sulfatase activity